MAVDTRWEWFSLCLFLLRMWLLVDCHAAVDTAIPMHIRAAISGLIGLSKKRDGFGKGHVVGYEMRLKGKWGIVMIIFYCIHV